MRTTDRGGLGAAVGAAAAALALTLAGCGGGGGGGGGGSASPSTPEPPPTQVPVPPPPPPEPTFTGMGTTVVYIDPGGYDSAHNETGRKGIKATAPGTNPSGTSTSGTVSQIRQALINAGSNNVIAGGLRTGKLPRDDSNEYESAMTSNPQSTYLFAAPGDDPDRQDFALAASRASNGLVAAAVREDNGSFDTSKGDDGHSCSPFANDTCINVNMQRGSWTTSEADSSWAVAKLAGYAALLREAFRPADGAELVRLLVAGANSNNVFRLDEALQKGGLLGIGNSERYYRIDELDAGGVYATTTPLNWTAAALAGPGAAVPVARSAEPGGLGLAAFATPGAKAETNHRVAGVSLGWRSLSWGVLLERDGFMGRPSAALLGARRGRWTWLGWRDSARIGRWRFDAGIEVAVGTADASRSAVVEDYGSIIAGAWRAEAKYERAGSSASLSVHQPPRTERARIRLRHGEGTVREGDGREIRFTAKLIGAGGWSLALDHVRHPGHDEHREAEGRIQAGWRIDL